MTEPEETEQVPVWTTVSSSSTDPITMMVDLENIDDYSHNEHEHSMVFMEENEGEGGHNFPLPDDICHEGADMQTPVDATLDGPAGIPDIQTAEAVIITDDADVEAANIALLPSDFNATCRLAARLGASAMNNGSIAENIERYLPKLMEVYGYYGFFNCSTLVLSCTFEKRLPNSNLNGTDEDAIVRTQNVPFEAGNFQLTKLGLLSDLAKDLMEFKIGIQQATQLLDEIEAAPDPWGPKAFAVAFVMAGATLPAIINGTWWDMLVGSLAGGISYCIMRLFQAGSHSIHIWCDLCAAFCCSTLGGLAQLIKHEIDPTIVTVAGVLILIPSSTITLGINDLVSRHVLSGLERLVKGMIIMLWLALGYVLGISFVAYLFPAGSNAIDVDVVKETVPALWQLLFIPILCSCVAVVFQMSGKDMVGAMICMFLGYATSFFGIFFLGEQPYLGSFIGSLTIATYANAWSRYYDRPNTIILFPAFQLVVAGIVGFMGLTKIVQGDNREATEEGTEQVQHMLIVAVVVVVGFLVGGSLVQPRTTI